MDRISRDELFIQVARLWALRSTCNRGQIGCVIVMGKDMVSHGYNGAPPGMAHCTDVGCEQETVFSEAGDGITLEGCKRTIHAEVNAIARAARRGISVAGATCYCTHSPCKTCSFIMASAGILTVVYDKEYRATPWDLLDEMGIHFYQWEGKLPTLRGED